MVFSRQEYWSGLPFPSPWDLSGPGDKPGTLRAPELADGFFTTEPAGMPKIGNRRRQSSIFFSSNSMTKNLFHSC